MELIDYLLSIMIIMLILIFLRLGSLAILLNNMHCDHLMRLNAIDIQNEGKDDQLLDYLHQISESVKGTATDIHEVRVVSDIYYEQILPNVRRVRPN